MNKSEVSPDAKSAVMGAQKSESTTMFSAEERAINFLLNEGREATFHARQEDTKTSKNNSDVRVTLDNGTSYQYKLTEDVKKSIDFLGTLHYKSNNTRYDMAGNVLAKSQSSGDGSLFQLYAIPLIPTTLRFSMKETAQNNLPSDKSQSIKCEAPRYAKYDAKCTGVITNNQGQTIASQIGIVGKDNTVKVQLFKPNGHYLGEYTEVEIKAPDGKVTTTIVNAHR